MSYDAPIMTKHFIADAPLGGGGQGPGSPGHPDWWL